jgi:transcription elongation factor Elf1
MSTDRTWKCPQCGHCVDISYDWLADNGTPICGDCDIDMELQPENEAERHDRKAAVERLVAKAESANLVSEDLDEAVHELAASIAADTNNGGLDDQIGYLVAEMGVEGTEKQLDRLIEGKAERSDDEP